MAASSNDNSEGRLDSTRAFFLHEDRPAKSGLEEEDKDLPRSGGREVGEEFFLQNIHLGDGEHGPEAQPLPGDEATAATRNSSPEALAIEPQVRDGSSPQRQAGFEFAPQRSGDRRDAEESHPVSESNVVRNGELPSFSASNDIGRESWGATEFTIDPPIQNSTEEDALSLRDSVGSDESAAELTSIEGNIPDSELENVLAEPTTESAPAPSTAEAPAEVSPSIQENPPLEAEKPDPVVTESTGQAAVPQAPAFDALGETVPSQTFVDNDEQGTLGATAETGSDSAQEPLSLSESANADGNIAVPSAFDSGAQIIDEPTDIPLAEPTAETAPAPSTADDGDQPGVESLADQPVVDAPTAESPDAASGVPDAQSDSASVDNVLAEPTTESAPAPSTAEAPAEVSPSIQEGPHFKGESRGGKKGVSPKLESAESNDGEVADVAGNGFKSTVDVEVDDFGDTTNRISGTSRNDRIFGSNEADTIESGQGNDVVFGRGGDDVFVVSGTQNGENDFHGGKGSDRIMGSAGDDRIGLSKFNGGHSVEEIDAGDGHDVVHGSSNHDHLDFSGTQLSGVEEIDGGDGNDRIVGSGGDDTILGGAGDDRIEGNRGNDTLEGGAGDDIVSGGAGDDIFTFNAFDGEDTFHGGSGWTDAIELNSEAYEGTDLSDNPWTIEVDGEILDDAAIAAADGALALNPDSAGVITMADGSELVFDGVEEIKW